MHDVTWWQVLIVMGFTLSTLDRAVVIMEHLGVLPTRFVTWLQQRWLRRMEDKARRDALDALLSNGITTKLDAVTVLVHEHADLLAQHIEEAVEDRRRLNALYERIIGDGETAGVDG